jgi:hypothetical protein
MLSTQPEKLPCQSFNVESHSSTASARRLNVKSPASQRRHGAAIFIFSRCECFVAAKRCGNQSDFDAQYQINTVLSFNIGVQVPGFKEIQGNIFSVSIFSDPILKRL